jgi:hypothetical protein
MKMNMMNNYAKAKEEIKDMTIQKFNALKEKFHIYDDTEDVLDFVSELLYERARELEKNEPYAVRSIDFLDKAAHEVDDLIDYVEELEDEDMEYSVLLTSCGNPDKGQNPYEALWGVPTKRVYADSIEELQNVVREYIEEYDIGGGNWNGGDVYDRSGTVIGNISYNGRYWQKED